MISEQMDRLALKIAAMDRPGLVRLLHSLHCDFPIDFTEEYLNSISLERLRHIVLGASLHDHASATTA